MKKKFLYSHLIICDMIVIFFRILYDHCSVLYESNYIVFAIAAYRKYSNVLN